MNQLLMQTALEKANEDYLDIYFSNEYRLGKRIIKLLQMVKKFDITSLITALRSIRVQKQIKRLSDDYDYNFEKKCVEIGRAVENRKVVVYTCITGGYDQIKEPIYYSENVDFVLFTDDCTEMVPSNSVWKKRKVEEIPGIRQNFNINRYCKMNPKVLFPEYDYSIYIDGNVQVVSEVCDLLSLASNSKVGIAMHRHSSRQCIYREAQACIIAKRGNRTKIEKQIEKYKKENFPKNYGMCEATIIVSDLHSETATSLLKQWWEEYCSSESQRDQLALPYVLWKNGYSIEDVGCLGYNLLKNSKFRLINLGSHSFK